VVEKVPVYDYIIVGAGSAGCVLAARLSENPATRVLLLEAGPPDDADEIHIPAALNLLFQSTYDWDYRTVPQERAAGRAIYWPRGRMLGGSSSMNAMIYIRGARQDYDTWRDEYGCSGWGYNDLMPYFRRAEDNTRGASAYHGEGGPLTVSDLKYRSALTRAWAASARACGLGENEDFNGPQQDGCGFYQVTQRDGRRWSAADAYLHPVSSQPNLTVLTDARATQVVVEAGRAVGVRYLLRGTEELARSEAEVILAAGAIGSPHLLMLSGIGPAGHLHEHGIIVHVDNAAVGANLSDHPVVTAMWGTPRTAGLWEESTPVNLARWRLRHSGPLTSNVAEAGGFTRTRPSLPAPDLQWHVLPTPASGCAAPTPGTSPPSTRLTCPTAPTSSRWWRGSGWPASSPARARSPRSASLSCRRGRRSVRTRRCGNSSGATSARSSTRWAPARWAATPGWRPAS
jgi:choline dehydrogenase